MTLQLNELVVEQYKEFYGPSIKMMPKLIADGRVPLSAAGLMRRRLETITASADLKAAWWDNGFSLGDAIAYHPDGRVKMVLGAQALRSINPQSTPTDGALVLEDGVYESLPGTEFRRNKLGMTGKELIKRQVLNSPVWNVLAHEDSRLLSEYTKAVFSKTEELYDYHKNMDVYIANAPNVPIMRPWCVDRLYSGSMARGVDHLDDYGNRLVGVAPGAPSAKNFDTTVVQNPVLTAIANGAPMIQTPSGVYVRAHESVKA